VTPHRSFESGAPLIALGSRRAIPPPSNMIARLCAALMALCIMSGASQSSVADSVLPRWTSYLPGPLERLAFDFTIHADSEVRELIDEGALLEGIKAHLRKQLSDVKPTIEIQSYPESESSDNQVTADVFYLVTVSRRSLNESRGDIIVGVMQFQLNIRGKRGAIYPPGFPSVDLFVSEPDRTSLTNTIDELVKDHIDRIIVQPIRADGP
jgi:hypothetical protein